MEHIYDILIIGGGPAGYTAALYGARAGLDTLVLEKLSAGGQMALTNEIDNYPGFDEGIDGFTLGAKMRAGAERFGAKTQPAQVRVLELAGEVKKAETAKGTFYARTVIFAAGAVPRKLDIPGEEAWTGRGVHYCAACDGMFYRGKTVVVAGGGNAAAEDAVLLSRICRKVIVVHRRDSLRAEKIYRSQLEKAENVEFCWNSTVEELVCSEERLEGIKTRDTVSGKEREIACDALFVSIGRRPATELVKGQLELDANGYVAAGESTKTNLPGVFAAGDVRTKEVRQIVTAAADGAAAVHHIAEYLSA